MVNEGSTRFRPAGKLSRVGSWLTAAALVVGSLLGAIVTASPAYAADTTCGYGTTGPSAATFCWFDMAGYSEAEATSVAGQPFTVDLGGNYTISFVLHKSNIAGQTPASVSPRTAPLEARFAYGSAGYVGVPGSPVLYSNNPGGTATKGLQLTLSDIEVVDGQGVPVTGYRFVVADAENNVGNENFTWSSDQPLSMVAALNPLNPNGCQLPLAGEGTTTVTCTGAGGGAGPYNGVVVGANTPSQISLSMSTFARSGVAFAIQTAALTLDKAVDSRVDADDSFDLAINSPEGTAIGNASTGTDDSATTGTLVVLPRLDDSEYTLTEVADPDTTAELSHYDQSWACSNLTAGSTTVLPSGTGTTKTVSPAAGDDIRCTITNSARATSLLLEKHAGTPVDVNADGLVDVGDTIQYSFDVTNTGAIALHGIAVSDPMVGSVTCPADSLAPEASMTCNAASAYIVTDDDVTAGSVDNTATVSGLPQGSDTLVTSAPSSTSTATEAPDPSIAIVKSVTPSESVAFTADQPVVYTFVVTNTGNVTLDDVEIAETGFSGTGELSAIGCLGDRVLEPDEQLICTASYTLTQDDVDAGSVSNSATVTGTPPVGDPVTSPPSSAPLPVDAAPAIDLVKSVSAPSTAEAGDLASYEFLITNAGNVTLNAIAVVEGAFNGSGDLSTPVCPVASLLPGQFEVCTASYTLTQEDINRGSVTNSATASGAPPIGTVVTSDVSSATLTIEQLPGLTLVKSASPSAPSDFGADQLVTYSFVVTNTGNVTITDISIDDFDFTGTGPIESPVCPAAAASLAPDERVTCTVDYLITQDDVDAGSVSNSAIARGNPPGQLPPVEAETSTVTIPQAQSPLIQLVKTSDTDRATARGQVVTYTFEVTNIGNTTLFSPTVDERSFSGRGSVPEPECPAVASLVPGEVMTCSADYTVVSADLNGEALTNTAVVSALSPTGDAVVSQLSTAALTTADLIGPLATTGPNNVGIIALAALGLIGVGGAVAFTRRPRT